MNKRQTRNKGQNALGKIADRCLRGLKQAKLEETIKRLTKLDLAISVVCLLDDMIDHKDSKPHSKIINHYRESMTHYLEVLKQISDEDKRVKEDLRDYLPRLKQLSKRYKELNSLYQDYKQVFGGQD